MVVEALKKVNNEIGVSKHLPITHLNDPTTFELSNGQVGSVLKLKGVPFDTATNDELNQFRRVKHHALCGVGEDFSIYEHTIRRKLDIHLDGEFDDGFTKTVNEKYHSQFKNTNLYVNELYITILYKGVNSGGFGKALNIIQKLSNKAVKSQRTDFRDQAMIKLKKAVQQMMAMLTSFKPRLLGKADDIKGCSELIIVDPLVKTAISLF